MCEQKEKKIIQSENSPKAIGPYSPGVMACNLVFLSGQLGIDPSSGELVAGGVEAQAKQALTNLKNLLNSNGGDLSDIVKTTIFLADIKDFSSVNEVYASFFTDSPPARSTIQVAGLPKGGLVEIEAIAYLGQEYDDND
jgi:2-iminobutanoate/2-iminopropanoate deaminase